MFLFNRGTPHVTKLRDATPRQNPAPQAADAQPRTPDAPRRAKAPRMLTRHQRDELRKIARDERMLRDIGLNREDVTRMLGSDLPDSFGVMGPVSPFGRP